MVALRSAALSLLGVTASFLLTPAHSQTTLSLHGSGTTNPSKCFWHIMAKIEEQLKIRGRLTYRAVGSGAGIQEFLGKDINGTNTLQAYNDFGSGDIPIDSQDRQDWFDAGIEFVQLPFVLSAVGFFHSIPGVPSGEGGLNMTACLLARVFSTDITTWDHPDILYLNPGLNVEKNYKIFVGRRVLGSSSTYSITNYLYAQCPQTDDNPKGWPADQVGSTVDWDESTNACDGSGPMTDCIVENEGAIGYIDVAHAHEEGLNEIKLRNGDGNFLTSKEAGVEGIQEAAKDLSDAPDSADGDFSNVAFYNKPGRNTWPISLVSYIYVRKNLGHMENPASRQLLKAFAKTLFDPEYIGLCERYGLIPVPDDLRDLSLNGLEMIQMDDENNAHEFSFETVDTLPGTGQGDYVISARRENFALYESDRLADDVQEMKETINLLQLELAAMRASVAESGSSGAMGMMKTSGTVVGLGAIVAVLLLGF